MVARILIIEDNQANLDLMVYLLNKKGYHILTAMDGEVGLKLCFDELPDLILCDIQIPKIDGFEVIRRIKSMNNALSTIPIIAITAYAMVGDKEKILSTGCDGYISKPIEPEVFVSQVESFLPKDKCLVNINQRYEMFVDENVVSNNSLYRGTILIVDDNPADRDLSEMLLRTIKFRPLLAKNVNEALEILCHEKPGLILSDFHMPHRNGLDFLKILKANPEYKNIPFVIISSSIQQAHQHVIRHLNDVDEVIFRPIDPQKFIDLIEKAWSKI
jgi:CheY-like chemotaxis protein